MAKHKIVPFPGTQSSAEHGFEKQFARLGRTLLLHPKFLALSHPAKVLYMYMVFWAGNKHQFNFAYGIYKDFMHKNTFYRALNELVAAGFITVVQRNKNLRKPNVYAFSAAWHLGKSAQ